MTLIYINRITEGGRKLKSYLSNKCMLSFVNEELIKALSLPENLKNDLLNRYHNILNFDDIFHVSITYLEHKDSCKIKYIEARVFDLVAEGDVERLQNLINKGIFTNGTWYEICDYEERLPLDVAKKYNHPHMVKFIQNAITNNQ